MATRTLADGFYANRIEVFYLHGGRAFVVASPDFDGVREIRPGDLPGDIEPADGLLTPEEAADCCRQLEAEFGLTLVESAE